ncbi:MAG: ABC transporter permease [Faecalibacterium sp.]|jgi:simple sugar transport system permease protein|nr:ABC transporter permease [Faecalibacterium sp.]
MNKKKKIYQQPLFLPVFCMLLILLVNLIKDPSFFLISVNNGVLYGRLIDIANRGSEIAILAVGMTLVVASSAGTDISVGSVMALCASTCCVTLVGYGVDTSNTIIVPMFVGILVGILTGVVCGCFNGALVAKLKIQPMVATLILYTAARAIGLVVNHNKIVYVRYEPFKMFGNFIGKCPIPTPIFIAAGVIVIVSLVLRKTALGTYIEAVGINPNASRLLGINSTVIIFLCYMLCGLCAGIAGVVGGSRIYSADANNIGLNFEMDAILAVALGGNSLGGGKFNLAGSIIGAYTIQALTTTLLAMGVSTDQAPVFKAIVIVIVVAIQAPVVRDALRNAKMKREAEKIQKEVAVQ